MQLANYTYLNKWNDHLDTSLDSLQTLIIVFGSADIESIKKPLEELVGSFPLATIIGASTAGEIFQDELLEDALVVAVMCFDSTSIRLVSQAVTSPEYSFENGSFIAESLMDNESPEKLIPPPEPLSPEPVVFPLIIDQLIGRVPP